MSHELVEMKAQSRALSNGILNPANLSEALQMADMLCKSTLIPKDFQNSPGNVLVALQWGMEIGLGPMQALQSIAVVNGRPSLWGDAVIALCRSHPICEWVTETVEGAGEDMVATCTTQRRGEPEPVSRSFSWSDAKRAGLIGKSGPWTQYPTRMMQLRARSWCLRDAYPDLLRGMAVAEEAQDIPTAPPTQQPVAPAAPTLSRTEQAKSKLLAAQHRAAVTASIIKSGAMPPLDVDPATGEIVEPPPAPLLERIAAATTGPELIALKPEIGALKDAARTDAIRAWKTRHAELVGASGESA